MSNQCPARNWIPCVPNLWLIAAPNKTAYAPGALWAKMFGVDRPNERHPATRYRGAFAEPVEDLAKLSPA